MSEKKTYAEKAFEAFRKGHLDKELFEAAQNESAEHAAKMLADEIDKEILKGLMN